MKSPVSRQISVVLVVLLALLAIARSLLIVDQTESVFVTEFGRPVRLIDQPGLYFKWPHQSARAFDRRLQLDTPPAREMLTRDKKNLEIAWYVSWRIADVDQFLRTVRTIPDARARLEDMAASVLAAELGVHDLAGLVNVGDQSLLDTMMSDLTRRVAEQAEREYGVEVAAVRLRRLNYPEEVRSAVFEQIRSERQRVAAATRAEGESQARVIRSAADRERAALIAAAEADAARTIGEGEAQAARIANEAHAADPAFYQFLKSLETYRTRTRFADDARPLGRQQLSQTLDPGCTRPDHPQARELAGELERADRDLDSRCERHHIVSVRKWRPRTALARSLQYQGGTKAMSRRAMWVSGFVLAVGGYLATGITVLQPDEVGIVRRFGAVRPEPWDPGLHWGLPWGMDRVDRIKLNQTRTIAVGAASQTAAPLSRAPDSGSDDFLTGDLNLVTAEALVQYRVRDPAAYLFATANIEGTLSAIAEWATTRALANRGIDDVLTTSRTEVALGLTRAIQALADRERLGISIVAIRLGRVVPPSAVAPAFADAARARSDRRQAITRAEEYRDRTRSEVARPGTRGSRPRRRPLRAARANRRVARPPGSLRSWRKLARTPVRSVSGCSSRHWPRFCPGSVAPWSCRPVRISTSRFLVTRRSKARRPLHETSLSPPCSLWSSWP